MAWSKVGHLIANLGGILIDSYQGCKLFTGFSLGSLHGCVLHGCSSKLSPRHSVSLSQLRLLIRCPVLQSLLHDPHTSQVDHVPCSTEK